MQDSAAQDYPVKPPKMKIKFNQGKKIGITTPTGNMKPDLDEQLTQAANENGFIASKTPSNNAG